VVLANKIIHYGPISFLIAPILLISIMHYYYGPAVKVPFYKNKKLSGPVGPLSLSLDLACSTPSRYPYIVFSLPFISWIRFSTSLYESVSSAFADVLFNMSRLNRSVIAASAERKRWLTGGGDATSPNGADLDHDGDVASMYSRAKAEEIFKELRRGYSSADTLRPHVYQRKVRSSLTEFASTRFVDRFVTLTDGNNGREVSRAAVAIAALRGPEDLQRCEAARQAAKNPTPSPSDIATKLDGGRVLKKRASFLPTPRKFAPTPKSIKNELEKAAKVASPSTPTAMETPNALPKDQGETTDGNTSQSPPKTPVGAEAAKDQVNWLDDIVNALVVPSPSSATSTENEFAKLVDELRNRKLPASTANLPSELIVPSERLPFLRSTYRRDDTKVFRKMTAKKKASSPKFRSLPRHAILAQVQSNKETAKIVKTLFPAATDAEKKPGEHVVDVAASQLNNGDGSAISDGQAASTTPENATKSPAGDIVHCTFVRGTCGHWKKLMEEMDKENGKKQEGDVEASGAPPPKSRVRMPVYCTPMQKKLQRRKSSGKKVMSSVISPAKRSDLDSGKAFSRINKKRGISKGSASSPVARPQRKSRSTTNTYKDLSDDDDLSFSIGDASSGSFATSRPSRKLRSSVPGNSKMASSQSVGETQTSSEPPRSTGKKSIKYKVGKQGTMTSRELKETLAAVPGEDFPYYLSPSIAIKYKEIRNMGEIPECNFDENLNGLSIVSRMFNTHSKSKKAGALNILTQDAPVEDIEMLGLNGKRFTKSNPLKSDFLSLLQNEPGAIDKYIGPDSGATKYIAKLAEEEKRLGQRDESGSGEDDDESDGDIKMKLPTPKTIPVKNRTPKKRPVAAISTMNTMPISKEAEAEALLARVCGGTRAFMKASDLELCAQWSRRDFSAFEGEDAENDALEVTLNVKNVPCERCSGVNVNSAGCEESIVLKLWRNMTWRKVRRLRHVLGSD